MISPVLLKLLLLPVLRVGIIGQQQKAGRRVDYCRGSAEKVRLETFLFFFWTWKLLDMLIKGYGRVRESKKLRFTAGFLACAMGWIY